MYGVNAGVPKTLVKYLVQWVAKNGVDEESKATLLDIVDTPISPELIPADENGDIKQKTEDLVGPYELHDFFLYYFLRFGFRPSKIYYLANIAFGGVYDEETIKNGYHFLPAVSSISSSNVHACRTVLKWEASPSAREETGECRVMRVSPCGLKK